MTEFVHGEGALREAEALSAALFSGQSTETLPGGLAAPGATLAREAASWPLWKMLSKVVEGAGATMSTSEARRLIQQGPSVSG